MSNVTAANERDFDFIVNSDDKHVLIDFWAPWCAPCRAVSPIVEQLADEYADNLRVITVNVDDNPDLAKKFGIRGIPTLTILKASDIVATQNGAASAPALRQFVENAIA